MYKVKEFVGNYDKDLFYSIMGKFFAERSYRKKLPYLINDKDKFWYIFFRKGELIGFCSIKIGQKCTSFPDLCILDDENLDDSLFIINYMFNHQEQCPFSRQRPRSSGCRHPSCGT